MNILISGPDFHQYNDSIGRGFSDLGMNVQISNWPNLFGNFIDRSKLLLHSKMNKSANQLMYKYECFNEKIRIYNEKLIAEINQFQPDIILILKGDIIYPDTIKKINVNKNIVQIIWCYDSALRSNNVLIGGKHFDLFYSFEPTDIQILEKYNIQAKFLPMGYDPNNYFKLERNEKSSDISFIGNISDNPTRKELLETISSNYKELNVDFWGKSWTWYNPFSIYEYKIKRKELAKNIHNYYVTPEGANSIYNNSKICLNVHHPQSKEGLNPRTFEVLGAGGFQLVEYKKEMDKLFNIGQDIICYSNENDLINKIEYYLENEGERKKIAQRGHNLVKKKHTYKHRAETILTDVEKIRG